MEPFLQIVGGPAGEGLVPGTEERFVTFLLVFVRCASLVASAPVIGSRYIPRTVKVMIALGTAVVLEASLPAQPYQFSGLLDFVLLVAGEALIGLMLGFVGQILFQSIAFAGEIMGQQTGFAIATVHDPTTEQDSALVAQMMLLIATLIFLVINGHQLLLLSVADTFRLVPPGGAFSLAALENASLGTIAPMAGAFRLPGFFESGIKIAGPVIIALITTTLAEAIIAKTVPQVNIMVLGFGIRILLGLFIMILSFPMVCYLIRAHLMLYPDWARTMISWLRVAPAP